MEKKIYEVTFQKGSLYHVNLVTTETPDAISQRIPGFIAARELTAGEVEAARRKHMPEREV